MDQNLSMGPRERALRFAALARGAAAGQSFEELVVAAGVDAAGHAAPQFPPHAGAVLVSGASFFSASADSAAELLSLVELPLAA